MRQASSEKQHSRPPIVTLVGDTSDRFPLNRQFQSGPDDQNPLSRQNVQRDKSVPQNTPPPDPHAVPLRNTQFISNEPPNSFFISSHRNQPPRPPFAHPTQVIHPQPPSHSISPPKSQSPSHSSGSFESNQTTLYDTASPSSSLPRPLPPNFPKIHPPQFVSAPPRFPQVPSHPNPTAPIHPPNSQSHSSTIPSSGSNPTVQFDPTSPLLLPPQSSQPNQPTLHSPQWLRAHPPSAQFDPTVQHISQRVTTSEFQLKLPRDLRFTAYEPHPFVDFDENDTFVPHFPSTDPLLITNIRRAGLIFLSLSDFVEEGHSFDDESLKKAILCLRIICNIQNMNDEKDRFTISHHELLRHIVPPTLDRTKLFLERVRILLSSPNATFIGSVLKLLEALLPRDEPGEAQAFWNSNIFSHLRISDADYEHISCTALISFLSFLSLQSFHLTNISIHTNHEAPPSDESAEKLLTEMLVPLKPLFLTLYRKRFQTENVIDNIRCPCVCLALLRDPFVTWKFHEATLHFVRSLPICLTILSVLIDHDKNREISNSLRHILCTFAPHSTVSSMRREKMLLTDMSSEGLDDEIELFVWTSERRLGIFETFTHIPVSSIACDLLRSLGGNSRFLFSD